MKLNRVLIVVLALGLLPQTAYCYSDRIDAPVQEIFDAAKACFAKQGIYKQDDEKKTLTTRWAYSQIRRRRNRPFVPLDLKENINLRSQMEIRVEPGKNYSEVSVVGRFEEKPTDAAPQQAWKHSITSKELYFKEREVFFQILAYLESQKKAAAPAPSQTA